MQRSLHVFCLSLLLLAPFAASSQAADTRITGAAIEHGGGGEQLVLKSTDPISLKSLIKLDNPNRIVLDFDPVHADALRLPSGYQGVIKGIRFGQFNPTTSRVVLDLASSIPKPATRSDGNKFIVDLKSSSGQGTSANTGNASAYDESQDEKPLIVIDAGHGGKDPGTIGFNDTEEKNVTLAFAKMLRKALLATGRYRVALTRDDDTFIMLNERVNIARRLKADMFVSLHADSDPSKNARGLSLYSISENASDAEAAALAARENSVDDLSGMDLGNVDKDVADVLIDLASRETKAKSAQLADIMVDAMHSKIDVLEKAHRFAGFRVLKAPDIPSVLIELGFLSNPDDAKLLLSPEYRDLVASSITRGVDAYYVTIKRR